MANNRYTDWTREELVKKIHSLEEQKKYGLVWDEERVSEHLDLLMQKNRPVLDEAPEMSVTGMDGPAHLLIEGDNFHALTVLMQNYRNKVDVIYIDPPYNTGSSDFQYKDKYVDADDAYRHSKWLSFMQKRLELSRSLLKETGLLFISIDDNELAQLRLLCDEIFGERNFRNTIIVSRVKKNIRERHLVKSLNLGHGTVLFYGASPSAAILIPTKYHPKKERWHSFDAPGVRKTMEYPLFGLRPPEGRHWMYEENKAREMIDNGTLRANARSGKPEYCLKASDHTFLDTNWTDLQEGDSKWILNGGKNVALVKRLLSMHPEKDTVVLDFFAGSGTTAEAAVELNREDGGSRQAILITNNENNICMDVCHPRVKSLGCNLNYYRVRLEPVEAPST